MKICPYNAIKALTVQPFLIKCEHEKGERNTIWNETKRRPVHGLFVKDRLSLLKRWFFRRQKATFHNTKGRLLQTRRQ